MSKYLLKRAGLAIITFIIAVFLFFFFVKLVQQEPEIPMGMDPTFFEKQKILEGWDRSIPEQFWLWLKGIFQRGNFGFSTYYKADVGKFYFSLIPATVYINIIPYFLSIPLSIIIGVTAALHKNKFLDNAISVGITVFISVPFFVIAVLAQYFTVFKWGWFPSHTVAGASDFASKGTLYGLSTYILPVLVLTISSIPGSARSVRAELTEQLTQDYMLLARSKGLSKRQATFRHALKNAIAPFLPGMLIGVVGIISGSAIAEQIFNVTGTGRIYLTAFNNEDYPMLMLSTVFGQFVGLILAIVGDMLYTLFDPRMRIGSGKIAS